MTAFVGRNEELFAIKAALAHVVDEGACHVTVVRGEAGIGKSRLLRQIMDESDRAAGGQFHVGYGQAMATSLGSEAYTAIRECLRSLASSSGDDPGFFRHLVQGVVKAAPDWLAAIPLIGDTLAGGAAIAAALKEDKAGGVPVTDSPLHQLISLVEQLADECPLLLVLDDLHWADMSTLDAIVSIALTLDKPVAMLLSYRVSDAFAQSSRGNAGYSALENSLYRMQRYLALDHRFHEITLGKLDEASMRQLVEDELHEQSLRVHDIDEIMDRAGGNPLFAATLAQLPWDRQLRSDDFQGGQDAITAVLREQLTFLKDDDLALLETAAIIGMAFEVDYLAALARKNEDDIYDIIDSVERHGTIVEPYSMRGHHERYAFHHPLLCELLRERAQENGPRWRRLNSRLFDVYCAEAANVGSWDDDVVVRAVECAKVSGRQSDTHSIAMVAAERQLHLGAVSQAVSLAKTGMDNAQTSTEKLAAARVLMEALIEAADNQGCATTFEALESEVPIVGDQALPCALVYARSLRMLARWDQLGNQLGLILKGSYGAPDSMSQARALMLRAEAELCGPDQDTDACLATLQDVIARSDEDDLTARALGHRALALLAAYRPQDARAAFEDCVTVARRSGNPYVIYEAIHWQSKFAIAILALDEADQLLGELNEISRKHGVAGQRPYHARDLSRVRGLQGRFSEAAASYQIYWDRQEESNRNRSVDTFALQVAELCLVSGVGAAIALMEEMLQICPDPVLVAMSSALGQAGGSFDARVFCVGQEGIDPAEFHDSDAIFRFDVPDLGKLRSVLHEH